MFEKFDLICTRSLGLDLVDPGTVNTTLIKGPQGLDYVLEVEACTGGTKPPL